IVLDRAGDYKRSWGSGKISDAHGIYITEQDDIFLIDRDHHQIMRFDRSGNLVLTIGVRDRPRLQAPFNHPADLAVGPGGDIYVADGYGNSCIHRFGPDGTPIASWGRPGAGTGELTTPHGIWVDRQGRVLVADRENDRIQVFTDEGKHL